VFYRTVPFKSGKCLFGTMHPTARYTFSPHTLIPYLSFSLLALSSEVPRKPNLPSLITNSSQFNPTHTIFSPTAQFNSFPAFQNRASPITLPLSLPIALSCLQPTFARGTSGRNLEAHDSNFYTSL
jgi:hypothetical protein